ncbi:MAG: T9SS type A sorting domain-containing protein, partial [Lentimicrobiaceae bacterium]|nr:T9SS type A sorting domain-containing protein [Lentimicrobiaceae bacterium]
DTVVRAYAVKEEVHSDTVAYVYTKPTVTPEPEPIVVAAPKIDTIKKLDGKDSAVVVKIADETEVYVATGKDLASATEFTKIDKNDTIVLSQDTVVRAYAVKEEVHSDTVTYVYTKPTVTPDPEEPEKVAAPVIDTIKGQDKADSVVIVKFDATKADSIFVATGKNLASATAFAKFTKNDTIVLSQDTAVRAYAMKDGKYSDTVRYIYTATVTPEPEKDTVATPVFSLKGEVNKGDTLYITCATEGAEIFYALDTVKFVKYENGIEITEDVTVKAFAKKGEIVSDTVEVSLTVKTQANEGKELSGVSIYPNPSNGEFKVAVPVNATVEMFNTNGQMVKRANLVAGVNTLRMNNSGIYFVRFTAANGQVVIKKVIVR